MMDIVGKKSLFSLIPYITTSGKNLKIWLKVGSKSEPENTAQ